MKDTNNREIQVGDLVKRCGYITYAPDFSGDSGRRYKVSSKTWRVSKIEGDRLFYQDENGNDAYLAYPKDEGAFLVVGDSKGFFKEHEPVTKVVQVEGGGVGVKYRVHGDIPAKKWKNGDIVLVHGKVSKETIDSGKLERVPDTVPHQHVLIVADPLKVFGNVTYHG